MQTYVVLDCKDTLIGDENVLAVFDDFRKARECVIHAVDSGVCNAEYIYVESYDEETGEWICTWIYEELIDGGIIV